MRDTILLICFLLLPANHAHAQTHFTPSRNTCLLSGQVRDAATGRPLPDVNISLPRSGAGTTSDTGGRFTLRPAPGEHLLLVSHIGYATWRKKIRIEPGAPALKLDIALRPVVLPLPGVTVTEDSLRTDISQYKIGAAPLRDMASPLPDVLLALKTLPGVASLNDQSALYNVRGGNIDENLIYINGVEIYQPQLVRKGVAENPSLVNPLLLDKINFRTGVFPVSYGDKLSSVLDLKYRTKFRSRVYSAANASKIGLNAVAGARPARNLWLQFGARRIRYGYLFEALDNGDYEPLFRDFQALLYWQPSEKLDVTVFAALADSRFAYSLDGYGLLFVNGERQQYGGGGDEKFRYTNKLASLKVRHAFNRNLTLKAQIDAFGQKEKENSYHGSSLDISTSDNWESVQNFDIVRIDTTYYRGNYKTARFSVQWLRSRSLLLQTGMDLKLFNYTDSLMSRHIEGSDISAFYSPRFNDYVRDKKSRRGFVLGRFVQANYEISKKTALRLGLRWTKSSLNHEQLLLPRARLLYRLPNFAELTLAAGRYAQPPIFKEFLFRDGDDAGLKAQKAWQVTSGYQRLLRDDLSLKIEAYFKRYSDLISFSQNDVQVRYSGENDARGYAYGLDVFLRGSLIQGTDNWLSFSYLVAREDLLGDGDAYRPRATDRRLMFAVYNEDKMERLPWSHLFVRFVFGTGFPYTHPKWKQDDQTGVYQLVAGRHNNGRLPFYMRVDLGFSQEIKIGGRLRIKLRQEMLNFYNRRNTLGYELAFTRLVPQYMSGRIINFGARVWF